MDIQAFILDQSLVYNFILGLMFLIIALLSALFPVTGITHLWEGVLDDELLGLQACHNYKQWCWVLFVAIAVLFTFFGCSVLHHYSHGNMLATLQYMVFVLVILTSYVLFSIAGFFWQLVYKRSSRVKKVR
jgi:hypothetical protein